MVSNAIPQGDVFFKNTVRTYTPSHCHEFNKHLNKLLVWNIGGNKQRCRRLNAELCAAVQLLFTSMQAVLDGDAWNPSTRRTDELFQSNDSYFCQP